MRPFRGDGARIRWLRNLRRLALVCVVAVALGGIEASPNQLQPGAAPTVYVLPIEGMIDLGLAPFVRRVLEEAQTSGAAAVVLEINTFGGRVDAAVQIRDALLSSRVRTIAYVNPRAISAGALISLAAEKIAMAGGGTIGAATPVQMGASNTPAIATRAQVVIARGQSQSRSASAGGR